MRSKANQEKDGKAEDMDKQEKGLWGNRDKEKNQAEENSRNRAEGEKIIESDNQADGEKEKEETEREADLNKKKRATTGKRRNHILWSGWTKTAAFLLQTASFAVLVVCAVSVLLFFSVYNWESVEEGFQGKPYEDTQKFTDRMMNTLHDFGNYLYCREIFETEGSYDGIKQIDVVAFSKRQRAQELSSEAAAEEAESAGEIQELSSEAAAEEAESAGEVQELSSEAAAKETELIENVQEFSPKYYLQDLISWAAEGVTHDDQGFIMEQYRPVGGFSLKEALPDDSSRKKVQDHLEYTITELDNWHYYYKEGKQTFETKPSNFKYMVLNANTKEFFTNIPREAEDSFYQTENFEEWRELAKNIRSYGKYCYINPERNEIVSNFRINELAYDQKREEEDERYYLAYQRNLNNSLINSMVSPCYIAVAADTAYPAADKFSEENMEYRQFCTVLKEAAVIGSISAAAAFLLFLFLTAAAGNRASYEGIYLNWFDRIKTELAAGIMGAAAVFLLYSTGFLISRLEGYYDEIFSKKFLLLWGGCAVVCNTAFLTGYLSLVKRIKAKTIWSNSVVKYILDWITKRIVRPVFGLWSSRRLVTKTMVLYGGILLVHVFVIVCFWGFGLFLALLMDLGIGAFLLREVIERQKILEGIQKITEGDIKYQLALEELHGSNYRMGEAVNHMGEGLEQAIASSVKNERMKTDLITNVSHDIKTPLTSIINYVDLLKRENIQDEKIKGYIQILDAKSQRLKHLTEDLVEASKVSSGNITLEIVQINFVELILQVLGEYEEKFAEKSLELVVHLPKEPVIILADGRRVCRILDNLFRNIEKYALENTRVYAELTEEGWEAVFSLKNISKYPLNIQAEELTERFIRGDISRSTEGSGLGLSIAKSLASLQKGGFDLYVDGDLFKVILTFPIEKAQKNKNS